MLDIGGRIDDETGHARLDRFGRAAAGARELRDARGGRLDEHDAEAFLLEPAPTDATQHREDVGAAVEQRQVCVGHTAEEDGGHVELAARRSSRARSRPAPAMATTRSGTATARRRRCPQQGVEPFAGHEPTHASTSGRPIGEAEFDGGPSLDLRGVERAESVGVDAGRDDRRPAAWPRRRARPRPRDSRRRPRRCAAPRNTRAQDADATRSRPGTVTSAPCTTTPYGWRAAGRSRPSGNAGSSITNDAPTSSARLVDATRQPRVRQAAPARASGSTRNGCAASKSAAPGVRRAVARRTTRPEPPPQLPQVRLDAADLRREVVGDQADVASRTRRARRRITRGARWSSAVPRDRYRRAPTPASRGIPRACRPHGVGAQQRSGDAPR